MRGRRSHCISIPMSRFARMPGEDGAATDASLQRKQPENMSRRIDLLVPDEPFLRTFHRTIITITLLAYQAPLAPFASPSPLFPSLSLSLPLSLFQLFNLFLKIRPPVRPSFSLSRHHRLCAQRSPGHHTLHPSSQTTCPPRSLRPASTRDQFVLSPPVCIVFAPLDWT